MILVHFGDKDWWFSLARYYDLVGEGVLDRFALCSLVHPMKGPIVEHCPSWHHWNYSVVGDVPKWFVDLLVPCG